MKASLINFFAGTTLLQAIGFIIMMAPFALIVIIVLLGPFGVLWKFLKSSIKKPPTL